MPQQEQEIIRQQEQEIIPKEHPQIKFISDLLRLKGKTEEEINQAITNFQKQLKQHKNVSESFLFTGKGEKRDNYKGLYDYEINDIMKQFKLFLGTVPLEDLEKKLYSIHQKIFGLIINFNEH